MLKVRSLMHVLRNERKTGVLSNMYTFTRMCGKHAFREKHFNAWVVICKHKGFLRDSKMHVSHTMRLTHVFQNACITHGKNICFKTYGARFTRLTYVLYRTFNACFMYGKRRCTLCCVYCE